MCQPRVITRQKPVICRKYKVSPTLFGKVRECGDCYFRDYTNKTAAVWRFSDKSKYFWVLESTAEMQITQHVGWCEGLQQGARTKSLLKNLCKSSEKMDREQSISGYRLILTEIFGLYVSASFFLSSS